MAVDEKVPCVAWSEAERLTLRQRRLLEEIPRCKSMAEAARRAGYSPKHAGQAGYLALKRIAQKAPEVLERQGCTLEWLIEKILKPGLVASRQHLFEHQGVVTDQRETPDWSVRLAFLSLALKLHGAFPDRRGKGRCYQ